MTDGSEWVDNRDMDILDPTEETLDVVVGRDDVRDLLTPLQERVDGIELVDITDIPYGALFQLTGDVDAYEVVSQVNTLRRDGVIHSTGMRVAILPEREPIEATTSPYERAAILFKIENWMAGCIPNGLDSPDVHAYIADRESEMSAELRDCIGDDAVDVDTHVNEGPIRAVYGQYHFFAFRAEAVDDE